MRHLAAIFLASLAAVACGNAAPDQAEPSASTAESVISQTGSGSCYSGYTYQCHELSGHEICGCEALTCNFDWAPPLPGTNTWIESWGVGSSDGSCPDIAAPTGTWKNLSTALQCTPQDSFDGVPCSWADGWLPWACKPSAFGTPYCCTYVWWPAGFVEPTSCAMNSNYCATGTPGQFPQVLCAHAGMTLIANEASVCSGTNCTSPGGGGCNACQHL